MKNIFRACNLCLEKFIIIIKKINIISSYENL